MRQRDKMLRTNSTLPVLSVQEKNGHSNGIQRM